MTTLGGPVEEVDLHARIDGQLPRERAEDVEAYLAASAGKTRLSFLASARGIKRCFLRPRDVGIAYLMATDACASRRSVNRREGQA